MPWTRDRRRRRSAWATTLSLCLASSQTSLAAEPWEPRACQDASGARAGQVPRRVQPLPAGCEAPFDGQLLETEAAILLGQRATRAEETLRLTLTATGAYWRERLRHREEEHRIELEAMGAKLAAAERYAEDARQKWYESPAFVIPVTVLGVVAVSVGTAELVRALNPEK